MTAAAPLTILPYSEDPLRHLATQILHEQRNHLPRLTDCVVLLPTPQAGQRLRSLLLRAADKTGHSALLGPTIDTLPHWIGQQAPSPRPVLSEHQRELMLVEALREHKSLYGEGNPWTLADSLLSLFDDLGATHVDLPASLETFLETLDAAYGPSNHRQHSLYGEAKLVHTLWQAWQQEMRARGVIDRHTDHTLKLAQHREQAPLQQVFYLAGLERLSNAEAQWLAPLLDAGRAHLILQASPELDHSHYHADAVARQLMEQLKRQATPPSPSSDLSRCLDCAFSNTPTPLPRRAQDFARTTRHSPLRHTLSVLEAGNAEQEAQAINVQVRQWWNDGRRHIGIVTENRRLARRVRALLERSGLELEDAAGWALSTTSAAAALERWLETAEEDFSHQPLLDFLKSPFLLPERDRETLLSRVYRFEQAVVRKENIARGMDRYRQHLRYRQHRLPTELTADYDDIDALLQLIEDAARPLRQLMDQRAHAALTYIDALWHSLAQLGLDTSLAEDAAGQRILEELQAMQTACADSSLAMHWHEFRTWLGRTLERFNFKPPARSGQVQLMSLAQASLLHFDALIIAGAEAEYLPGTQPGSPFFNDGVRQALGLAGHSQALSEGFLHFRSLLEAADTILVTRRREQDGEAVLASPWLDRLQSFHQLAYGQRLDNAGLAALIEDGGTLVTQSAPAPQPTPAQPATAIPVSLFPKHLSASGYQQLINCPYQFFAARCLQLEAPESIREMLQKADYGERVHRCLQAFHSDLPQLPGPFTQAIDETTQEAAIDCLSEIARAVFARDLEDNFLHRGWLRRWQEMIPAYIQWQQTRQQQWRVKATELEAKRVFGAISLSGRLDRMDAGRDPDSGAPVLGIIDYKTGAIPKDADVLSGESVQLPFYALLAEQGFGATISQVEYLNLDANRNGRPHIKSEGILATETLDTLIQDNAARLERLLEQINAGTAMPAWGDEVTCQYCQMDGICRREAWVWDKD